MARSRTLCEVDCQLVTVQQVEAGQAPQGHICYPDITLEPATSAPTSLLYTADGRESHDREWDYSNSFEKALVWLHQHYQAVRGVINAGLQLLADLLQQPGVLLRAQVPWGLTPSPGPLPGALLAWHPTRPLLAVVDGPDRVLVHDLSAVQPRRHSKGQGAVQGPSPRPLATLQHKHQTQVTCIEWRPNNTGTLAIGCAAGICLWSLEPASLSAAAHRTISRTGQYDGTQVRLLSNPAQGPIAALAWQPSGYLIATSSQSRPGLAVWDAASGQCTSLSAGSMMVGLLSWSPCGACLLAGSSRRSSFQLWDTQSWQHRTWHGDSQAGRMVGAAWTADGRGLILGWERATQLAELRLTRLLPHLEAQLWPLQIPQLPKAVGAGPEHMRLRSLCWDPTRQRLVLSASCTAGDGAADGLVAVLASIPAPLLSGSLRLIGCMHDLRNGPDRVTNHGGHASAHGAAALVRDEAVLCEDAKLAEASQDHASNAGTGGLGFSGAGGVPGAGLLLALRTEQGQVRLVPLVI
ncbi:hypothetical protein WJX74_003862 [Apatococcus lobatus]|uniref:Anaphase-promoting complex subunit 4 WD40 domain-containing protein n=1 Tax=Apatococcus lobatus TaxID=904363 RepID=A0AAW1RYI4_9CHLO